MPSKCSGPFVDRHLPRSRGPRSSGQSSARELVATALAKGSPCYSDSWLPSLQLIGLHLNAGGSDVNLVLYRGRGPQTVSFVGGTREGRGTRNAKRELPVSDYTSSRGKKIHKNNFRVSLPRCRAVRSMIFGDIRLEVRWFVVSEAELEGNILFLCLAFVIDCAACRRNRRHRSWSFQQSSAVGECALFGMR